MLTSLAFIFLVGLSMAAICQRLKLPRIIGMLITGIILGPYVLDLLDPSILSISAQLRQMALIIILLKAGLSLNLTDLKRVGRPAVMMACIPASCEILAYILLAPSILDITRIEAAVMGAVLGAVSPGSRYPPHGSVNRRKIWNCPKHPPAYNGRRFLRRYFCDCTVFHFYQHGTGWSCQFYGFHKYPYLHYFRNFVGRNYRLFTQFIF